jgi:hypothetical protein
VTEVLNATVSQGEPFDLSQTKFVKSLAEVDSVLKLLPNCLDKALQLVHKDKLVVNKDELD